MCNYRCKSGGGSGKHKSYMTVDQLVTFLNQQQRDPRLNEILYPYVTHERARDIINQYEVHKGNAQKGKYGLMSKIVKDILIV